MSDCILWTGAIQSSGYGSAWRDGKSALAHRVAFEDERGPIPDGMTIDHLCREKLCINTAHMELVTRAENARRGVNAYLAATPEYPCGHPRTDENTITNRRRNGHLNRICRQCQRAYQRAAYARRKAAA